MPKTILIVEDEEALRESLKRMFQREGFSADVAGSAEAGLQLAETNLYDVILSDIILPGMDGIEMLVKIRRLLPEQIFIVMTAYASLETAVKALRAGAYDYIVKPVIHEEVKQVVRNAINTRNLKAQNILLRRELGKDYDFSDIIGKSPAMLSVIEEIKKTADTRSSILLLGETGTGKELMARIIHRTSARADMPFVPINCSAIPETLLESELFGYARGAFTGAAVSKKGLLDEADGGTVFLDEIGDLSQALQAKLLRVIEDHEIRPLGSIKSSTADIRFITATNKDLKGLVSRGEFREDLYYRINVIALRLPPLRERKEDIAPLVNNYASKYSKELGKRIDTVSDEAMALLADYRWPGNVRELQNVIERAVLISDTRLIEPMHLPENVVKAVSVVEDALSKTSSIEEYTKNFILRHQGSMSEMKLAAALGITRKTLWEKRKKWGIIRGD